MGLFPWSRSAKKKNEKQTHPFDSETVLPDTPAPVLAPDTADDEEATVGFGQPSAPQPSFEPPLRTPSIGQSSFNPLPEDPDEISVLPKFQESPAQDDFAAGLTRAFLPSFYKSGAPAPKGAERPDDVATVGPYAGGVGADSDAAPASGAYEGDEETVAGYGTGASVGGDDEETVAGYGAAQGGAFRPGAAQGSWSSASFDDDEKTVAAYGTAQGGAAVYGGPSSFDDDEKTVAAYGIPQGGAAQSGWSSVSFDDDEKTVAAYGAAYGRIPAGRQPVRPSVAPRSAAALDDESTVGYSQFYGGAQETGHTGAAQRGRAGSGWAGDFGEDETVPPMPYRTGFDEDETVDPYAGRQRATTVRFYIREPAGTMEREVSFGGDMIIGRLPTCQLQLPMNYVSKEHIRLTLENGAVTATNLTAFKTAKYTWLNRTTLGTVPMPVKPGDILVIHDIQIHIREIR